MPLPYKDAYTACVSNSGRIRQRWSRRSALQKTVSLMALGLSFVGANRPRHCPQYAVSGRPLSEAQLLVKSYLD